MLYSLSQRFYFRELSRTIPAGQTVELDPEVADKYMHQWPGLLKPERQTTQAHPQAVRKAEPQTPKSEETPKAKQPKATRTTKKAPKKKAKNSQS